MNTESFKIKLPELATARYADFDPRWGVPLQTSIGAPKWWKRPLEDARFLAPFGLMDVEDRDEFEAGYLKRLDIIGIDQIARRLNVIAENYGRQRLIALCFEDVSRQWCHRTMLSAWLKEHAGVDVRELASQEKLW